MTNLNTGKYSDFRSEWDDKYYTAYALIEGNISGHLKGVALSVGLHVRTLCAGTVLNTQSSSKISSKLLRLLHSGVATWSRS